MRRRVGGKGYTQFAFSNLEPGRREECAVKQCAALVVSPGEVLSEHAQQLHFHLIGGHLDCIDNQFSLRLQRLSQESSRGQFKIFAAKNEEKPAKTSGFLGYVRRSELGLKG